MLRLAREIPVAVLAAVLLPAAAPAQTSSHPLDPLTASEYWVVYDVLRGSGHLDEKTRYAAVRLNPPPKTEVLAWKPGQAPRREAFAVLVKAGRTFEAVVDLAGRRLVSWREVPDAHAGPTDTESEAAAALVKENPAFVAALRKRGITDLATLDCWGISPGYFGRPDERERRLQQVYCYDRHGVFNSGSRPIEGLSALVDVGEGKLLRVIDTGAVAIPKGPVDYDPASVGGTREVPTPLSLEQPLGPAFRVDGQRVSWQNWRFHFRIDARRGVVISEVRYQDGERLRGVLYEAGLSELFVPYMDPAIGWYNLTFLDLGDNASGGLPRPLEPRAECPENAVYFDSLVASDRGIPQQVPRSACLFERLSGEVAWTHREQGVTEARARRDLVLRWTATIGNYDYVFDWLFRQDGSLEGVVGATGIVVVKAVPGRSAADQAGRPESQRDDAHGRFVAENSVAVNHDHFFNFRLDLDVDGPQNSFVFDRLQTQRLPEDNPRRSIWVVESQTATRESQARIAMHDGEGNWRVINPSRHGPMGYPVSYQIRPGHSASSLLLPEDYPQKRAGFTRYALWVTPQRDNETYAAGEHTAQSRGEDGLPAWTSADRPIENNDIVAWYTLGMHHVVRAEDWPVMPAVWHSFELRPFDFFARNPALDLPRQ